MIQNRPECFSQRIEPTIIVAPLRNRIVIDGPLDLLGAGREHTAIGFPKAQACLLKRQAAVIEQPACFHLRVGDQILVEHPLNSARQYLVEMGHQSDIVAIVKADIGEIVGWPEPGGKKLLEVRETASKGMPADVDDLGVGQDGADQPEMMKIAEHLVGEESAAEFSICARPFE